LALVCLITWLSSSGSIQAELKAGAAKISIAPPFPTQMGGFHDRVKNFEGVHDELLARALVLDNGGTQLVFIGSDLMAIDAELVRLAREAITQATKIPAAQILISCTHNHSAPSYYQKSKPGEDDVEPSLKKFLAKQFSTVAIEAHQNLAPAKIGFGAGSLIGATRNRQQRNDLIDPQVGVLRVESTEGRKTIATLFNFTGHPVIVGSTNMLLTGEYPGAASRAVENLLGGVAIFTQGACGDITVNRSGDPFMEIERFGRTVAGEVIKVSGLIQCADDVSLKYASQTLKLPALSMPDLDTAKQALAQGQAALDAAKAKPASTTLIQILEDKLRVQSMAVLRAEAIAADPTKKETELTAEVQVLQVGSVIYAAIPGEIFVEYALELRQRVKQETGNSFCLIGYANGYLGYIVTPRAMETGGYEASITRLQPLGGRALTEAAMELVQQLNLR